MEFDELKTKMENMGFKFEWVDKDMEGTEEDEDTGKEKNVTYHAKGWRVQYPPAPGYYFYPVFADIERAHPERYLEVMLDKWERRHDGDEENARMVKHLEESK